MSKNEAKKEKMEAASTETNSLPPTVGQPTACVFSVGLEKKHWGRNLARKPLAILLNWIGKIEDALWSNVGFHQANRETNSVCAPNSTGLISPIRSRARAFTAEYSPCSLI
ncbi:hypothetical protein M9H77_22648 [Catharanthus roseus]|uniref:Uncharacterized protein n=1 Tax=Catharanthus roseus TaxID=4058 RepID=A0ACC0AR26_CATRO|nr:hypothetical protein M9H77_22648 [Catharanthus roseus]